MASLSEASVMKGKLASDQAVDNKDSAKSTQSVDSKLARVESEDEQAEDDLAQDTPETKEDTVPLGVGTSAPKKKKKKPRKSKLKKGANQPTGFEEYFVDPPVTPVEFAEEQEIYSPDKDFHERIETAIARFYSRRKFGEWQAELFQKYLVFGGFETNAHAYHGFDDKDPESEMTAIEKARAKAYKPVAPWVTEGNGVVDFEGVLKAFFSEYIFRTLQTAALQEIKARVNIIFNFLNYLLHHDVCPEYKDQVEAARTLCSKAEKEVWSCHEASFRLPGSFNMACSSIFGGYYHSDHSEDASEEFSFGIAKDLATRTFFGAMACHTRSDMVKAYQQQSSLGTLKSGVSQDASLEVVSVEFSSDEVKSFYSTNAMHGVEPTGKLVCKYWDRPDELEEDYSDEEEFQKIIKAKHNKTYEFWVEDSILEKMFVGMHMEAEVRETSFGLQYLDTITGVQVSFYHHISNSDMLGYREHEYLKPREKVEEPELKAYIPDRTTTTPIIAGPGNTQ